MIAALHHDEQLQRIGAVARGTREVLFPDEDLARCLHVLAAPGRDLGQRRVDEVDQGFDLLVRQVLAEARHLRLRPPFGDHGMRFVALQASEVLGQQRRPRAAETIGAVTAGAVLAEQGNGVLRPGIRAQEEKRGQPEASWRQSRPGAACGTE